MISPRSWSIKMVLITLDMGRLAVVHAFSVLRHLATSDNAESQKR